MLAAPSTRRTRKFILVLEIIWGKRTVVDRAVFNLAEKAMGV